MECFLGFLRKESDLHMRMAKRFGLVLMVLALLVSFAGTSLAGAWPETDVENKYSSADVWYGFGVKDVAVSNPWPALLPHVQLVKDKEAAIADANSKIADKKGKDILIISNYTNVLSLDIKSGDYDAVNTIRFSYADGVGELSADIDGGLNSADISGDTLDGFKLKLRYPGMPVVGKLPSSENDKIGYFGFGIRLASISKELSDFVISKDINGVPTSLKITIDGVYTPGSGWDEIWSATVQGPYVPGLADEDFYHNNITVSPDRKSRVVGVGLVNDYTQEKNDGYQYELIMESEEFVLFGNVFSQGVSGTRRYILSFKGTPPPPGDVITPANYQLMLVTGAAAQRLAIVSGTTNKIEVNGEYTANLKGENFIPDAGVAALTDADVVDKGNGTYDVTIGETTYNLSFVKKALSNSTSLTQFAIAAEGGNRTITAIPSGGFVASGNYITDLSDLAFIHSAAWNGASVSRATADSNGTTYTVYVTAEDGTTGTEKLSFANSGWLGGSSGGGCDAGLGAFGLIILAGSAMVLRRKK
ncbi:hypothetical protein FACS1894167_07150 [Synergistales bacterium]|nr:hypothetical protein FACS1894167_07150 [Synergistales bacterium]